jgi:hypothetical protein
MNVNRSINIALGKETLMQKKSRTIASTLFVIVIISVWLGASARINSAEAQAGGTLYTTLVAQNMDANTLMNARITYNNPNGSAALNIVNTVLPYHSIALNQPSQTGLSTNFSGTAMLDADMPFAGVVFEYAGNASALGPAFKMEAYTLPPSNAAATTVLFPQLLKNIYDAGVGLTYNSSVTLQNTGTSTATVTFRFINSDGATYDHPNIAIPGGGSYTIDLATDSALAGLATFYGIGRATANQSLVAVAHHRKANTANAYPGFSSINASTTLYLPQLLKTVYDAGSNYTWGTGVQAMSLDGTPANVTLTYLSTGGSVYSESVTAYPFGNFDQRYSPALSGVSSFYGSGILTADKPIVAIINIASNWDANRGLRAASYQAIPDTAAKARVFLPKLAKSASDSATGIAWSTSVVGRLASSTPTIVTLTYYLDDGTTEQQTQLLTSLAPMFTFDQRYASNLLNGRVMSGVLSTNPPQPIVGVSSFGGDASVVGDTCYYYNGVGQ